jgi:predicted TIM-barrel fold metal-dependent hydrolase
MMGCRRAFRRAARKRGASLLADSEARPLPDDLFVIDAVVHALNLDRANVASRFGEQLWAMSHGLHMLMTPPHAHVPAALYMTDMPGEILARTLFEETVTSLAATHTLTLDSWFHDGFAARHKTEAMVRDFPGRVLGYVGVDPSGERAAVLDDLEAQVAALPDAVGLKLYPHQMDPYRHWRTNDDTAMAVIARARDLGLKTIAIHKALPNGSVPLAPYRIGEDFELAVDAFPEMAFEIVHSGMAFIEETAMAIGRFPNVYANLETTTALLWQAPGRFAAALALLAQWGGITKLLWGTGCTVTHPQHLIEAMWAFQFSDVLQDRHGIAPLTDADRRAILGGNYARMIGRDMAGLAAAQAGDGVRAAGPREAPLKAPWTVWTEWGRDRGLVA